MPPIALQVLYEDLDDSGGVLRLAPLDRRVAEAVAKVPRDLVPEMPDRIIAATALAVGLPRVTRDLRIRSTAIPTIW